MSDFYINPLSVNEQCYSANEVLGLFEALVECFEYFLPAIKKNRAKLFFDSSIENRQIIVGESLASSIHRLPIEGQDVKKLWYIYTRNRAEEVSLETTKTTISSQYCPGEVEGFISNDKILQRASWLSFGRDSLHESMEINVLQNGLAKFSVKNAHHLNSLKKLLPCYESNEKHSKNPYYDHARSKLVAAMPLNNEEAQRLLLTSLEENKDRLGYDETRRKFYRFKLTYPGKNIYHGFEIEDHEISNELIRRLK